MKFREIIKNSVLIVLLVSSFNCSDLNVEPTSVITNNSFWNTEDDVRGAVNGMYVQLRSVASQDLFLLGEARSEILSWGVVGTGGYDIYYNNTLTSDNAGPSWLSFYKIINTCNLIIKYTDNISFTSQNEKESVLAQAYSMRAFVYFVMVRTWGELIIHTEPIESTDPNLLYKERSSLNDVFSLIKSDIEKALQLFPNDNYDTDRIKWSKPALNALKGEVFLWTGKQMNGGEQDFSIALNTLNEIKKTDVTLLPEFNSIFNVANKGNKEILMSVRFAEQEATNFYWMTWLIGSSVPADIDEETRNILFPIGSGQGIIVPSKVLIDQYLPGDTRKSATLHEIYTHDSDGDLVYYTSIALKGAGLVKDGTRHFISDVILYRYADVLLLIAEAKNALGQDPSEEINLVRQRAYKEGYPNHLFKQGSKEFNDEAILKERLLELAYEGKRWWDLLRFNKAFELVPSLQTQKDKQHLKLYPISNSVLSLEPKVKQNPGY